MMNVVREVLFGGRGKVEGMRERMEATDRKINDLLQYIDVALNNVRRVSRLEFDYAFASCLRLIAA